MKKVKKSALIPFPAESLYELVADIESYPQFLSWCSAAKIISSEDNIVEASITIAYHGLHKKFTTHNENVPGKSIHMELADGPFHYLDGTWNFQALDKTSCKVMLDIGFKISNPVMRLALGGVFEKISNSMVEEFVTRAYQVLKKPGENEN